MYIICEICKQIIRFSMTYLCSMHVQKTAGAFLISAQKLVQ